MWEKLPPIKARLRGCLHAPVLEIASMDALIAVGFGDAFVVKDKEIIYSEPTEYDSWDLWTFQDAENEALKDPDHDWRVVLYAPLRGSTFQRQDVGKWVLVDENNGFC